MNSTLNINGRIVGPNQPVYLIAEMSANHNGDFDQARRILYAAKEAGADAVKLQTYTADTITLPSRKPWFKIEKGSLWEGRYLHDLYQEAFTPWEWQPKLLEEANRLELHLFSSPFDFTAVDFLEEMNMPAYKIASFENGDLPLIERVVKTGKPILLSTGTATLDEVKEAVSAVRQAEGGQLALLKCTSAYPARPEDMNLSTIPFLAETFGTPVGLSDHTMGLAAALASVTLGASIIEKHFTLSREQPGPDSAFSMEPDEFKAMVDAVRQVEKALGQPGLANSERDQASRQFRRSLFVAKDIQPGEALTESNIRSVRPGNGLPPKHWNEVLGRKAARFLEAGDPLRWEDLG